MALACALRRNQNGHLWTVGAEEEWARATESGLPEVLRPFVTVVHSPAVEDDRGVPGLSHERLPDLEPDFVYLDGPALTPERQIAFDVLDLGPRLRAGCFIVVDGRRKNAPYLHQRLTRKHSLVRKIPWRYVFELTD